MKNHDLADLVVLVMDCQTTGANPKIGSIIEIGWARSDALCQGEQLSGVNVRIFKKPADFEIPMRVRKVTGIEADDIAAGSDPAEIWKQVVATAEAVAALNGDRICPTVIHFAKFEIPFLTALHVDFGVNSDFPFTFICTHEICRRLFPELPRRSMRAIAGYFGYSVQELRRCKEHVHATALIWQRIVEILKEKHRITTFAELICWLNEPVGYPPSTMSYPMSVRTLQELPQKPGVYRMLRSNGDVLYVGKAKSLKPRVMSYFRKSSRHPEHLLEMLSQAKRLDVTVTESVLEAALLESDEIKRLAPPYNIALRKHNRDVWFCTNDFCEFNSSPTVKHRVGPIVDRELMSNFAVITRVAENGDIFGATEESLMRGVGSSKRDAPDLECLKAGYSMFLNRHAGVLRKGAASLRILARRLWAEKQRDRACGNDETESLVLKSIEMPVWTPRSVCRLIEHNVMRAGHAIRRARWFTMLTESSLGWLESRLSDGSYFIIVFEKGQILYQRRLRGGDVPSPPGHRRRFADKQYSFDVMTYDRMRVMTTEVRNLVNTGRWVEIRFSPVNAISGEKLANLLCWI